MLKTPVFVKTERFDINQLSSKIMGIRDCFDRYLDNYPVKTSKSKTSLMGPVGKVLQAFRIGKWDQESLIGYALNIHLSNPKTGGYISQQGRESLKEGINKLFELMKDVPLTAQDKVLDRIDYGLYFVRRVKNIERLERIRSDFIEFIRKKYLTVEKLAEVWGGKTEDYGTDFSKIKYPSKTMYEKAPEQIRNDIMEFSKEFGLQGYELIDEEENGNE